MPVTFTSLQTYEHSSSSTENHFDVYNPATGNVITTVAGGDVDTTNAAIEKAETAFKSWRTTTLAERGFYLLKCADALEKHKQELGEILCLENGKPFFDALMFDVTFVIYVFRFFGSLVDKLPTNFHDRGTMYVSTVREPKGVTGRCWFPWHNPILTTLNNIEILWIPGTHIFLHLHKLM